MKVAEARSVLVQGDVGAAHRVGVAHQDHPRIVDQDVALAALANVQFESERHILTNTTVNLGWRRQLDDLPLYEFKPAVAVGGGLHPLAELLGRHQWRGRRGRHRALLQCSSKRSQSTPSRPPFARAT